MNSDRVLLTVGQAAERLGVGRSFLYAMVMRGEVPSIKLGRSRRIPAEALQRFVEDRLKAEAEASG